ncbi:MAG: hypothetical protein J6B79_02390 [Clostridia bacterium]|nr:hypothetical protein [Clostridia bacterium]
MTKKAKRIISIVIVSIILVSSALLIISCNAVKEYEYKNLEDAYEAGWITEDDLRTIADYWNNNNRPEMQFSQKVEDRIKYTNFRWYYGYDDSSRLKFIFSKSKRDMHINYYGTYNGYVVARVNGRVFGVIVDPMIYDEKTIGGVTFYKFIQPWVYKIN